MRKLWLSVHGSIIWAVLIGGYTSESTHCGSGWFGRGCEYRCRCTYNHCRDDGQCLGGSRCQGGWFGPECQYVDLAYGHTEHPVLTDSNDTSCLNGPSPGSVAFTFPREYLFTWLQLVFRSTLVPDLIDVQFGTTPSVSDCYNRPHVTDKRVVDIHCRTDAPFHLLVLSGHLEELCSLHVNGGRNIALRQSTSQSSTYLERSSRTHNQNVSYPAEKAVDGNSNPDFYGGHSCARTKDAPNSKVYWMVTFPSTYYVDRYVLYFSNNATVDTSTYSITSFDEQGTPTFNGSVHGVRHQLVYTIIHRSTHVHSVHITSSAWHLDLCEVEVYGDSMCTAGHFGLDCGRTCNCPAGGNCYASTGQCYPACREGFEGETCFPCRPGNYGANCQHNCSQFCVKDHNRISVCHNMNGSCLLGCEVGYQRPFCRTPCDVGTYGHGCSSHCNPSCIVMSDDPGAFCHHVNGNCMYGCKMGYIGDYCTEECKRGTFGYDCRKTCPVTCAAPADPILSPCNFTNGHCLYGCMPGFNGTSCGHGDPRAVLQGIQSSEGVNTLYVVAFCSALVVIALLMFFVNSKENETFLPEEDIRPDTLTR